LTTKAVPASICQTHPDLTDFLPLIVFMYEFEFSPISKREYGTCNKDIRTHPKHIP